jgi:hypothetical protein
MHILISAAAPHAAHAGIPHAVATGALALAAAAVVCAVLKIAGRILSPKKKKAARRSSSPYASTRK